MLVLNNRKINFYKPTKSYKVRKENPWKDEQYHPLKKLNFITTA